jgi:mono/diheme cytochrome c family protein
MRKRRIDFLEKGSIASFFLVLFLGCQSQEEIRYEQYMVNGEELYVTHCANCHQKEGTGLKNVIPPLVNTDYLNADNKDRVICLIKNGIKEPLVVNGQTYTQAMPANKQLQPIDIAAITTYIYSKWGGERVRTDVVEVEKVLQACEE